VVCVCVVCVCGVCVVCVCGVCVWCEGISGLGGNWGVRGLGGNINVVNDLLFVVQGVLVTGHVCWYHSPPNTGHVCITPLPVQDTCWYPLPMCVGSHSPPNTGHVCITPLPVRDTCGIPLPCQYRTRVGIPSQCVLVPTPLPIQDTCVGITPLPVRDVLVSPPNRTPVLVSHSPPNTGHLCWYPTPLPIQDTCVGIPLPSQ